MFPTVFKFLLQPHFQYCTQTLCPYHIYDLTFSVAHRHGVLVIFWLAEQIGKSAERRYVHIVFPVTNIYHSMKDFRD